MNGKERKTIYISIGISLLLHLAFLIFMKFDYLLGSPVRENAIEAGPLELVFEQPNSPEPEERIPEKFYELVENPRATGNQPEQSDMLSTESSLSQAPAILPGELRAVPGNESDEESPVTEKRSAEQAQQSEQAVKNALLAYAAAHSFNKSALSQEPEVKKESGESASKRGETTTKPEGFKAELIGDFALSTYAWNWAPYWLEFKRKLMRVWYAPPAYSKLGLIYGHTIVRFTVLRDGQMKNLRVLRQVGHQSLETSSVSAIESTFPLNPLPSDFPDEELEVTIKMIYPNLRAFTRSAR